MSQSAGSRGNVAIDAIYVIDHEQRIVEWSDAASFIFGVDPNHALGQRCFEIVRGRGPFGRPACQPDCSAFKAIQRGRIKAYCSILLDRGPDLVQRLRCELFALPRLAGGALVKLQERVEDLVDADRLSDSASSTSQVISMHSVVGDLAVLANLSNTLSFFSLSSIEKNLERVLDILREAAGAESAELFLSECGGGMVLSAYRGPFKNAFSQITRFPMGKGYPGLVAINGQPIVTHNLTDDARFLRTSVKGKGFKSYICLPLPGADGLVGALNLAWRGSNAPIEDALRLAQWASGPLGSALENSLHRLREAGASAALDVWGIDIDPDRKLREFMRDIMAVGNACGAVLMCYEPGAGAVARRVIEGQSPELACIGPGGVTDARCPALAEGRGIALYGPKERWHPVCRQSPAWPTATYCLPIVAQGKNLGMVQLGYRGRGPSPPTQYLRLLHEMAQGSVHLLRETLLLQRSRELMAFESRLAMVNQRQPLELADGSDLPVQVSDRMLQATSLSGSRGLEVRCFGVFDVHFDGQTISLESLGRRAAATLLKILLLHRGRTLSRDFLIELLWPEVDPDAGARRLHVTVHALRQALEQEMNSQRWRYIRSKSGGYYFHIDSNVRLDLNDFETYAEQGGLLEKQNMADAAIEAYAAGATLYRGDLFQDEPYAEWCWQERERLREEFIRLTQRLAALFREGGRPDQSVEYCRRALQTDPLREDVHSELMISLWKGGRRTEALQQFQICTQILREQLDVAPLTETRHLFEKIKLSTL